MVIVESHAVVRTAEAGSMNTERNVTTPTWTSRS